MKYDWLGRYYGDNLGARFMRQSRIRLAPVVLICAAFAAAPAAARPGGGGGGFQGGGGFHGGGGWHGGGGGARAFSAPHFSAPHFSAPRISTPRVAPHIASTPRIAPHVARSPATPHIAPQRLTRPALPQHPVTTGQIPSARTLQHVAPTNQASRALALVGAGAASAHVLRNQFIAKRPAFARATFQGRFAQFPLRHRHFRPIVIGWFGPLFWPYAYDDFLDYAFYPYAYDSFWPYAYDDVYDGMFGLYEFRDPRLRRDRQAAAVERRPCSRQHDLQRSDRRRDGLANQRDRAGGRTR